MKKITSKHVHSQRELL